MKKRLGFISLICILGLCGCAGEESKEISIEETKTTPMEAVKLEQVEDVADEGVDKESLEESLDDTVKGNGQEVTAQISIIAREKDIWMQGMEYANDIEMYAITDMDGNGRLELIASNCGGTGHYTYSRFYEVNETYDGLVMCETNFTEEDSQPDIMSNGGLVIVYEDEQGVRYHLFEDMLHDVADYYYTKFAVSLQNGKVFGTPLAINLVSYSDAEEYPTYTHMNGMDEVISQEEYARVVSDTFAEVPKKYVVNWSRIEKQTVEKASEQELEGILREAYETTTWNVQEELSHYGKWEIEECVGYARVSAVSKEEAATYIGKELTYEKNKFCFDQAVMSLSEAGYGFEVDTKEDFLEDFGITGLNVEIPLEFTWCHVLVDGSFFGQSFVILDDDRILIYYEGAFFEAVRVGGLEASLTTEQIEMLSQKPILTTQDLIVYEGLQQTSLTAADYKQYYYDFTHEDKPYRLEIRSGTDDELQFVRLVDMETMLNIDIRTGNVEHLWNNAVTMADYLTCDLPEGVTASGYDLYQGHFGGEILLKNGKPCGGIYILDGSRVKPGFSGDELLNVANYENNIFHEEAESLSIFGVPALLTLMTVEEADGALQQYYSIYFAKESGFYCYNIRLQTDMFSKDEALDVANSVVFESRAFAASEFTFADVSNLEFFFCSGAGGWWTQMYIHEDGTFDGYYVDSNWGITGEDYPNGQVSYSEFYGNFTEPTQVDDYTYQVQIGFIEYPKGKGSEIVDGVLYDYGEAYGLQGGEKFYIYLPGKKYQELPEDFRLWVNGHYHWTWNGDSEAEDAILPFYGFFNVEQCCGFYSYEKETSDLNY